MYKRFKKYIRNLFTNKNSKKNAHQQSFSSVEFSNKSNVKIEFVKLCKRETAKSFSGKMFANPGRFCYY